MEELNESTTATTTNGVGYSSATTAWFEFILDETLLERHLSDPNAGECRHTLCIGPTFEIVAVRLRH